jgi:hypothetical protein
MNPPRDSEHVCIAGTPVYPVNYIRDWSPPVSNRVFGVLLMEKWGHAEKMSVKLPKLLWSVSQWLLKRV